MASVLLFPLLVPTILHATDWPQWRGPNRDGISQEKGLLKEWPKDGPKLVWQVKDIGAGFSTPAGQLLERAAYGTIAPGELNPSSTTQAADLVYHWLTHHRRELAAD